MRISSELPVRGTSKYLVGPYEPVVGRKVDDNPRIPRPIQDGRDRSVERAADETAGIQVPLVPQLFEDRREQIFRDPLADLHRRPTLLLWSPNRLVFALRGGHSGGWVPLIAKNGSNWSRCGSAPRRQGGIFWDWGTRQVGRGARGMKIEDEERVEERTSRFSRSHLLSTPDLIGFDK